MTNNGRSIYVYTCPGCGDCGCGACQRYVRHEQVWRCKHCGIVRDKGDGRVVGREATR